MTPGVLHAPLIEIVALPDTVAFPRGGRARSGVVSLAPVVVVAGAPQTGKSSLVNAVLEAPGLAPVDAPDASAAWLLIRYGAKSSARAFVPGRREPRPIGLDGLRSGETQLVDQPPGAGRVARSRPPRRIEITHPAELLRDVTLVDTPGVGDRDGSTGEVVLDIAERGAGMVFVCDATTPLGKAQLELLAAAAGRLRRVAFVLTKTDEYEEWPELLAANRAALERVAPTLAGAPWFTFAGRPGADLGDLDGLRALLVEWVAPEPAPVTGPLHTATVSKADDEWRAVLDREIRARRLAAAQRVAIDLATTHVRCVQELGSGRGCPELPYVLDRELHALSVRATRQLEADVAAITRHVFTALLDAPPDEAVLARITSATRRTVDSLDRAERERDRALLLTTTSGVAVVSGPGSLAGFSAAGAAEPADAVLPPIGIGLTSSCYLMWQPRQAPGEPAKVANLKDCRRWVQHALRVVEVEVERELAQRFGDLQQALAILATDAVDHGVLLA